MKSLESLCQNDTFLKVKVALLTFYKIRFPEWFERVLLMLEYLQLVSQGLLHHLRSLEFQSNSNYLLFEIIVYFFRLINPSELFSFTQDNSVIKVVLITLFGLTVLKFALVAYIICITLWNRPGYRILIDIWRFLFKMQSRITCFFVTSFWVKTILAYYAEDLSLYGMSKPVAMTISIILIIIEYAFSYFLEIQFCYVLPTKSLLSSKNYGIQLMTLSHKLVIQVLQLILQSPSQDNFWIISTFNLILSSIKQYKFYQILPLYNLKTLLCQSDLLSLITSLNLACFMKTLLDQVDYETTEVHTVIVFWAISYLLISKMYKQLMQKRIASLLTGNDTTYPSHMLINKITASIQLRKLVKIPSRNNSKYNITYFLSFVEEFRRKSKRGENSKEYRNDFETHYEEFLQHAENMSSQYPTDNFVKVYSAYLCAKSPDLSFKAIRIIAELKHKTWSKNHLSALLLIHKIQKTIRTIYQENKENLDVLKYIHSQVSYDHLKKEMLNETDLKITICNNILSETSDIGKIQKCAYDGDTLKKKIEKKISLLTKEIPDSFMEPLLLWAGYHLILNYSIGFFKKFSNLWMQKQVKYNKSFQEATLNHENLYQESNAFLVLSGEKHTNGQIVYCSSSIQNICGGQGLSYQGSHVSTLFTPSYHSFYTSYIKQITETGHTNQKEQTYVCHKDGHLIGAELLIRVHPYITRGLYLNILIRPIPNAQECLLIRENGDIEGCTGELCKVLGINSLRNMNIKMFSEELHKANESFNLILRVQKDNSGLHITQTGTSLRPFEEENSWNTDYQEALELYRVYKSEGKTLGLATLNDKLRSVCYYHCQISVVNYGSALMKIVKVNKKEREYNNNNINNNDGLKTPRGMSKDNDNRFSDECDVNYNEDSQLGSENLDLSRGNENVKMETNNINYDWKTDANLLSSNRTPREIPTSVSHREKKPFLSPLIKPALLAIPDISFQEAQLESHRAQGTEKVQKLRSTGVSKEFQLSQDQSLYKIFKTNISTKTYPKSFKPLCLSFYFVIFAALFSQIILRVLSATTLESLLLKKNLLNYSQLRSYKADLIAVNYFSIMSRYLDPLGVINRGALDWPYATVVKNANVHEPDLKKYNRWIINHLASLDNQVRQKLLAKDVTISGTFLDSDSSNNVTGTSFDAIDIIISGMHKLTYLPDYNTSESFQVTKFMVTNIINDFLYKSEEITSIFIDSVREERENLQSVISLVIIVTPLLLGGIAVMLTVIIYHQYLITKKQLLAFITLDAKKVKDIMASFNSFKKVLIGENRLSIDHFLKISISPQNLERGYRKQNQNIHIEYTEIKRKYYGYFFRAIFFILILIAVMIWNYASAQHSVNLIYRKQSQLEFANHISELVSTTYLSVISMSFSNDTYKVKHLNASVASNLGLEETKAVRSQILEEFKELDGTYDPRIKTILLDHRRCSEIKFPSASAPNHCKTLENAGGFVNLVSVLTINENTVYNKIQDWNNSCDRSSTIMLLECAFREFQIILPSFNLAAVEAQMIGDIVGTSLEQQVADSYKQRDMLLVIFSVSLILVSMLTWFLILKNLREVHNEFKKVLQVFPPTFVLSSFLLKTFLQQNSKSYLNYT